MKSRADKGRSERQFAEGDLVYLKLQPHMQTSIAARPCHKLSFRFYGPYKILKKVGQVAYKLELPLRAQIHLVVHVSQLKKHVPPSAQVSADLSAIQTDPEISLQPLFILDRAFVPSAGATTFKVKV